VTIDIHPHVIAQDERRYPRAPLGGRQSDWSRERPVSAEQMFAAMDEAGIERSVLVQASTGAYDGAGGEAGRSAVVCRLGVCG